jgi:hypothetical protein
MRRLVSSFSFVDMLSFQLGKPERSWLSVLENYNKAQPLHPYPNAKVGHPDHAVRLFGSTLTKCVKKDIILHKLK